MASDNGAKDDTPGENVRQYLEAPPLQEEYDDFMESVIESTWEHEVETGLDISWPGTSRPLHLSTKMEEDAIAPLFDGTQWAGTRVWKAAVIALEYLRQERPLTLNNNLLELGCGLGVPAMLWHLLHESTRVVLTDQPDLLPQLDANVKRNFQDTDIQAKSLSWSKEGVLELLQNEKEPFGICLNCDCVYEPLYGRDSWEALADVLSALAKESPQTLFVTSVERRNGDGLENFLERLTASGTVQPIQRVLRNDTDKHHVIEIYITRGRTD